MKPRCSRQQNHALTLVEVLVVIIIILVFLAAIFLPALAAARRTSHLSCVNMLKQIGLASRIWAGDNNDKYPTAVPIASGGVMELAAAGNAAAVFQVMSNELSTPKVLICPKDKEHMAATNFSSSFTTKNTSYFIGLDAGTNYPLALLSGDCNLEFGGNKIKSGVQSISTNAMYFWNTERHNRSGNVVLVDDSVQSLKNSELVNQVRQTGLATNRLAIP